MFYPRPGLYVVALIVALGSLRAGAQQVPVSPRASTLQLTEWFRWHRQPAVVLEQLRKAGFTESAKPAKGKEFRRGKELLRLYFECDSLLGLELFSPDTSGFAAKVSDKAWVRVYNKERYKTYLALTGPEGIYWVYAQKVQREVIYYIAQSYRFEQATEDRFNFPGLSAD
ncbi:MAG: hypothetical protein EOO11_23255 [Chitinophagaceae bacterium]|nr:MAG: hypothetical protein EOO11_23255 [Chitinophagaceae bacterium]